MFGRASGKSKLLKTHDDVGCMLLRCARGIPYYKRARCKDVRAVNFAPSSRPSPQSRSLSRCAMHD